MKLALAIGHGPKIDQGATNARFRISELEYNRGLASMIASYLTGSPVQCLIVDRVTERVQPVAQVNALNPDLCVELHCNAFDGNASGTEMICYPGSTQGKRLAQFLQDAALSVLKLKDRGVKDPQAGGRGMALLRGTKCPAVIWEPFFIDNDIDLKVALDRKEALARAFAQAVLAYAAVIPANGRKITSQMVADALDDAP